MATAESIMRPPRRSEVSEFLRRRPGAVAGAVVLLAIIVGFSLMRPATFPTVDNLKQILNQTAVGAIVACGASVALVAGQYDLSIGAIIGLTGVLVADVANTGAPWTVAALAACGVGAAIGCVNAGIVSWAGVPSIVTTLGTQTILLGIITWTTGDVYVTVNVPTMQNFAQSTTVGLPNTALIMIAICVIGALLMRYTVAGRNIHAIGFNPEASRLAGVSVTRYVFVAFAATGVLVGLAAVLLTAQLGAGHPEVSSGYLLPAFAAAFLGAAVSRTGTASIMGALYGALLLQCVTNGLVVVNAPPWSQNVIQGVILITAVAVSQIARVRSRRS